MKTKTPNKTVYALSLKKRTKRVVVVTTYARYYYNVLDIEEDPDSDLIDGIMRQEIEEDGFAYCYSFYKSW